MSMNFRYPNITGSTEKEQIAQIKSYLHQLADQLNYAFSVGAGITEEDKNKIVKEVQDALKKTQ